MTKLKAVPLSCGDKLDKPMSTCASPTATLIAAVKRTKLARQGDRTGFGGEGPNVTGGSFGSPLNSAICANPASTNMVPDASPGEPGTSMPKEPSKKLA